MFGLNRVVPAGARTASIHSVPTGAAWPSHTSLWSTKNVLGDPGVSGHGGTLALANSGAWTQPGAQGRGRRGRPNAGGDVVIGQGLQDQQQRLGGAMMRLSAFQSDSQPGFFHNRDATMHSGSQNVLSQVRSRSSAQQVPLKVQQQSGTTLVAQANAQANSRSWSKLLGQVAQQVHLRAPTSAMQSVQHQQRQSTAPWTTQSPDTTTFQQLPQNPSPTRDRVLLGVPAHSSGRRGVLNTHTLERVAVGPLVELLPTRGRNRAGSSVVRHGSVVAAPVARSVSHTAGTPPTSAEAQSWAAPTGRVGPAQGYLHTRLHDARSDSAPDVGLIQLCATACVTATLAALLFAAAMLSGLLRLHE